MLYHVCLYGAVTGTSLAVRIFLAAMGLGWVGVDLFFVLSGFLITGILCESRRRDRYFSVFYARRTLRIFPLYYASLVFVLICSLLLRPVPSIAVGWYFWLYALNWKVGIWGWQAVSPYLSHFWSLAVEEQFYLIWPLLVRYVSSKRLAGLCGLVIVAAPFFRMASHAGHYPVGAYTFTICRADALCWGALLSLRSQGPGGLAMLRKPARFGLMLSLVSLALVVLRHHSTDYGSRLMDGPGLSVVGVLFASSVVLALTARTDSWISRVLSRGPLVFLGTYSYGLYVVHQPVVFGLATVGVRFDRIVQFLGNAWLAIAVQYVIVFGITITLALGSWHVLEKHFLKLKNRPLLHH
jgi:peptidoglycan/LPS O-acetylase OafA/YrhL